GYFGFAYYTEHSQKLRAVPIQAEPDTEPILPTLDSIYSGDYEPLSRPLYIYVKNRLLKRPEGAGFVRFYLENVERLAREGGYVPPTEEEKAKNLASLAELETAVGPANESDRPVVVDGSSTVF